MANASRANGFTARKHINSGVIALSRYHIASALAANLFVGDAVIPTATSKNITVAAAGNRIIGVFNGCQYIAVDGSVQFARNWVSGTVVKTNTTPDAWVYDDPQLVFYVQASGAFALADIGAFADLTKATSGNALTGQSGDQLDSTTIGSGTVFKILDYDRSPDNDITTPGTNTKVLVGVVLHYLNGAMTAI